MICRRGASQQAYPHLTHSIRLPPRRDRDAKQRAEQGTGKSRWRCISMSKETKSFRKQARTAERVSFQTGDTVVAGQMKNLAEAFRAQADVLKKKRKKKK